MHVIVGADHAGIALKAHLVAMLIAAGYRVTDIGAFDPTSVDYPDFAQQVATAIHDGVAERGVLVCGSGIGMAIAANRTPGVRAVVLRASYDAQMSREHNDANVACFGERVTDAATAEQLLREWLDTPFAGERHIGRVRKIDGGTV